MGEGCVNSRMWVLLVFPSLSPSQALCPLQAQEPAINLPWEGRLLGGGGISAEQEEALSRSRKRERAF